jgi:Ca-activated chloride channel homolog
MTLCAAAIFLALDASASVSFPAWEQQIEAHAEAFEHPEIRSLIRATGPIYVRAAQFSDTVRAITPWVRLTSDDDAFAYARVLRGTERMSPGGTALGAVIRWGVATLADRPECERHVIDVVTDGEADVVPVEAARDEAAAADVQINALGIRGEWQLDPREWLQTHVITPGGFAAAAEDWRSIAIALRRKLIREIAGL